MHCSCSDPNLGLKTIPVDRRRHRDRETRLLAIAHGILAAAEIGMKEHDRLALARQMMERKLAGGRTSSKLPELVELVRSQLPLPKGASIRVRDGALLRAGDEEPIPSPPPRERADEASVLRAFVVRTPPRIEHADVPPCEPIEGGAELHRLLARLRAREREPGLRRRSD